MKIREILVSFHENLVIFHENSCQFWSAGLQRLRDVLDTGHVEEVAAPRLSADLTRVVHRDFTDVFTICAVERFMDAF